MFEDILGGFVTLFSDDYAIWFVILAAFVGIIFGALPGLTAAAAIAMMLPILIAYNDEIGGLAGLAFLYVIGKSGRYGGSIAPLCACRQARRFRPAATSECHSVGITPNRSRNRCFQAADRAISGNRINTCLPASIVRLTASK